MRKIAYVSGTRADFGLMRSTLDQIHNHPALELSVLVTGMHLSAEYGLTVTEIESSALPIRARIPIEMAATDGASMALAISKMIAGFTMHFSEHRPDMLLVLGDRGEMLAAVIAAVHLNIPIMHIHGGERSGTVDEMVRHAITKFSHIHCASTQEAQARLIAMGEHADLVFVTGAPGLDALEGFAPKERAVLFKEYKLDLEQKTALMIFHPVLQEAEHMAQQTNEILAALHDHGLQILAVLPNSDAGGSSIRAAIEKHVGPNLNALNHLPREDFLSLMTHADVMIGNSSAGIIEAATFGVPVINIGERQNLRERNSNVMDAKPIKADLISAISKALEHGKFEGQNLYGDGKAGKRIVEILATVELNESILRKTMPF